MKQNWLLIAIIGFIIVCAIIITGVILFTGINRNPYAREAESLYGDCDNIGAFGVLVAGIETYPDNEELSYMLIKVINEAFLLKSSDSEYSTATLYSERIAEKFKESKNPKMLVEIGSSYYLKNDRVQAVAFSEKALKIDPNYYSAYNLLGNCYYDTDFSKGVEYYEKLFALHPEKLNFMGVTITDEYIFRKIIDNKQIKLLYMSSRYDPLLAGLGSFTNMEVLSIAGCELDESVLPSLRGLARLKVLSLYSNRISRIDGFSGFTGLKALYLNNNWISRIENLDGLPMLRTLELSGNQLTKIENLAKLTRIENLYLKNNKITVIENLEKLTNLKTLSLYDNKIGALANLGTLTNLVTLDLYFNQISKLENLNSLSNLQKLLLRQNQIEKLENLDSLVNLKVLDLYENKIGKIENLDKLRNLETLILYGGQISKIENLDMLTNLRELDLRKNRITRIDNCNALGNLRMLFLSFNQISKIENLDLLANLRNIYLSYNQISKIENLDKLTGLRELYLGENRISTIENLDSLANLETLYLSNNKINKLENLSSLLYLKNLHIGTNLIAKIENLDALTELDTLNLYSNKIVRIENLDRLTKLRYLYLSYNQIGTQGETEITIPASFANMKSLVINGPGYMNPGNIQSIKGIENLKNIEEFEFAYQNLKELPDMSNLDTLRKLLIEKCVNLKPVDFRRLPTSITSLTLWNVNLKNLDGIERLVNLDELWVGENLDLTSLSNLAKVKTLKKINVSLCINLPPVELLKLNTIDTVYLEIDKYPQSVIKKLQEKGVRIEM